MKADATRVATARRWFRALGRTPIAEHGVTIVATPDHPATWEANYAEAAPGADPQALLAALDRVMPHTPWRVVVTDALTDPAIEAALALAGFSAVGTAIEMLARRPLSSPHPLPAIETRRVATADDWKVFAALVRADHREGLRTGEVSDAVGEGLLDAMRRRTPPCDYWLIVAGAAPLGYGLTVRCPGALGLIEHLFILPEQRGRGLMSAFIVRAAAELHAAGADAVFIDAHVGGAPARLYAALGFAPVALTRTWARNAA